MVQDIDKMLSWEIKKEIADRYFGFRKLIEEDIGEYDSQIVRTFRGLEKSIGFDLVRIYILLKDEQLIQEFFRLTGLGEKLFFDPYLAESPTIRKRVFADIRVHGLTRRGRFRNVLLDTYQDLVEHIRRYRDELDDLSEEQQTIAEEIRLFYEKNDLGTIMGFLRGIGGSSSYKAGSMEGGLTPNTGESLDRKMKVQAPPPVEEMLPVIPELRDPDDIRGKLKALADRAWEQQGEPEMRELVN